MWYPTFYSPTKVCGGIKHSALPEADVQYIYYLLIRFFLLQGALSFRERKIRNYYGLNHVPKKDLLTS